MASHSACPSQSSSHDRFKVRLDNMILSVLGKGRRVVDSVADASYSFLTDKLVINEDKTSFQDVIMRMLLGDPITFTDHALSGMLSDLKTVRVKGGLKLRADVSSHPATFWREKMSTLPHFFTMGLFCRMTGFCDFCDFTVAIAREYDIRFTDAYRLLGGDISHSKLKSGTGFFFDKTVSGINQPYPLEDIPLTGLVHYWRPEKVISFKKAETSSSERQLARLRKLHPQIFNQTAVSSDDDDTPTDPVSPSYNPQSPADVTAEDDGSLTSGGEEVESILVSEQLKRKRSNIKSSPQKRIKSTTSMTTTVMRTKPSLKDRLGFKVEQGPGQRAAGHRVSAHERF